MSRLGIVTSVAAVLCLAAFVHAADDQAAARAVVDKAVKALGGADPVARLKSASWKNKSKVTAGELMIDLTEDWYVKEIGKFHVDVNATVNGNNVSAIIVFNGDKGWTKVNDKTNELPKPTQNAIRQVYRSSRLLHLLPRLREKPYELSPLGELKVENMDAVGIRIIEKDRPDVSIYFDKKTYLPIKAEVRVAESEGGAELTFELFLTEFKDFDGIKHPTKLVLKRDGNVFMQSELSDLKPQDVEDATFDKP